MDEKSVSEFEKAASVRPRVTIAGDFWQFLRNSRKYWLLPILLICLLLGALMLLANTAATPFLYTLF